MLTNQRRALIVAICCLLGAAIVAGLVEWHATKSGVQSMDDAVWRACRNAKFTPAVWFCEALAFLGSVWVNWPLRIAAAVLLAWKRRWLQLVALTLAVASSEALIGTLKAAFNRTRPPGSLIATSGASFPSGHAIATAVTAVGLVVVLLPAGPSRWAWEVRAVSFTFLMALSRVYLRAHWLSDVIAGGLLGAGLAIGWPALLQSLLRRPEATEPAPPVGEPVGG